MLVPFERKTGIPFDELEEIGVEIDSDGLLDDNSDDSNYNDDEHYATHLDTDEDSEDEEDEPDFDDLTPGFWTPDGFDEPVCENCLLNRRSVLSFGRNSLPKSPEPFREPQIPYNGVGY